MVMSLVLHVCSLTNFVTETTAHTLSFILGHLALYPDVQAKVFEEIQSIWPDDQHVLQAEEVAGRQRF